MEASQKHACLEGRWPCVRRDAELDRAVFSSDSAAEPGRPRLRLVPVEPAPDAAELQSEDAGTARLMAAMALARSAEGTSRRDTWL